MILAFVEHEEGTPAEESLEALSVAREVAEDAGVPLASAAVGSDGPDGDTLGDFGVGTGYRIEAPALHPYAPEAWAAALEQLIEEVEPDAVIGGGIERTQEVLARLGATLDVPFAANCNEITPGDPYEAIRQRWGGSLLAEVRIDGDPTLLSVTPHERSVEPAEESTDPSVESFEPDLSEVDVRVRIERIEEADIEGIPLGEARVVVGGGRGVGSAEDFDILEELADELGGTVGSSRAAVNEGWRPHDDQIGLTGAKISPEIYIPCGISGAVQHWVGAKGAEHVLAINTDPEAAIIQRSDWAVVGDLHEVVPAITAALRDGET